MFYGVDPLFRAQLISAILVALLLRAAVSCLGVQLSDTCNPPLSNLPPRRHRHRQRRLDDPQQARALCAARRPLPSYPPPPPAARHEQVRVCTACCTPRCRVMVTPCSDLSAAAAKLILYDLAPFFHPGLSLPSPLFQRACCTFLSLLFSCRAHFDFISDCIYSSLKRGKTEVFKRIVEQQRRDVDEEVGGGQQQQGEEQHGSVFVAAGDGDEEAAAAARLG